MPSVSKKQERFMAAAANNPDFAKRAGISQNVAREFHRADQRKKKFQRGGLAQAMQGAMMPRRGMMGPTRGGMAPRAPINPVVANAARQRRMAPGMAGGIGRQAGTRPTMPQRMGGLRQAQGMMGRQPRMF